MIDLIQLEKEIDELLESETTDSLKAWYATQNESYVNLYIGEGSFVASTDITKISFSHNCDDKYSIEIISDAEQNKPNSIEYSFAA